MTTETYILPAYWASYLINGDDSGISGQDKAECDQWLESNGNPNIVDCGESYFSWDNEATTLGGDVCDYTALK